MSALLYPLKISRWIIYKGNYIACGKSGQNSRAYADPASWRDYLAVYCAMRLAAGYYGPTNRYGTISLSGAVSQAGLIWDREAYSAVTDAVMTARVVNNIAGYWH